MSTFHTLPSGKIMYKVKGDSVYSIYGPDDRTHLVSLSGEDLLDISKAMKLLCLSEWVNTVDPESVKPHTEAEIVTKSIASISHSDEGIVITYKDGTEKYFEEKVK